MGQVPTMEKLALTALLPLGIIMLAIGMSLEDSDPDEIVPAFNLKQKFAAALGPAFASDPDAVRQACRMIGALKIIAVFNVWYFRNANVACVLAAVAVPSFLLVAQTHLALGEPQGSTAAALLFAALLWRAAVQMKAGEPPAAAEEAPAAAGKKSKKAN